MAKKWQQRNGNSYLISRFPNLGSFFPSSVYEKQSTRTRLRVEMMVRTYISYFKCLNIQRDKLHPSILEEQMVGPNLRCLKKSGQRVKFQRTGGEQIYLPSRRKEKT